MQSNATEQTRTTILEQLHDMASTLNEALDHETDPVEATDLFLTEHTVHYLHWMYENRHPHPQRHNWEQVIEQNWHIAQHQQFARDVSFEVHKLAMGRLLEDMWPDMRPSNAIKGPWH